MSEIQNIKININIKILPASDEKLEEIARLTFRKKGDVIDWLISEKFNELSEKNDPIQA